MLPRVQVRSAGTPGRIALSLWGEDAATSGRILNAIKQTAAGLGGAVRRRQAASGAGRAGEGAIILLQEEIGERCEARRQLLRSPAGFNAARQRGPAAGSAEGDRLAKEVLAQAAYDLETCLQSPGNLAHGTAATTAEPAVCREGNELAKFFTEWVVEGESAVDTSGVDPRYLLQLTIIGGMLGLCVRAVGIAVSGRPGRDDGIACVHENSPSEQAITQEAPAEMGDAEEALRLTGAGTLSVGPSVAKWIVKSMPAPGKIVGVVSRQEGADLRNLLVDIGTALAGYGGAVLLITDLHVPSPLPVGVKTQPLPNPGPPQVLHQIVVSDHRNLFFLPLDCGDAGGSTRWEHLREVIETCDDCFDWIVVGFSAPFRSADLGVCLEMVHLIIDVPTNERPGRGLPLRRARQMSS